MTTAMVVVAAVLSIAGCGGGGHSSDTVTHAFGPSPQPDGLVAANTISYRSPGDGGRVSGLVAIPRAVSSRGCAIWQNGLGATKETTAQAWPALASLGLSTLSIDLRFRGAPVVTTTQQQQVIGEPDALAQFIRGAVADLRGAVAYLGRQPYCRGHVVYVGVGMSGIVGTILAATDRNVEAAVLISTPGTWQALLTTPGEPILAGIARDPTQLAAALRILSPLDPARFIGRIAPRPVMISNALQDESVVVSPSDARRLESAAHRPKTISTTEGAATGTTSVAGEAIASFLLHNVVEPTFGISANANGTFASPSTRVGGPRVGSTRRPRPARKG
ncbi:MAG: hypothetical protein ACRDL5_03745 [Solirubrobacteraceae bacterium]